MYILPNEHFKYFFFFFNLKKKSLYLYQISYNVQHGETGTLHLTHPEGAVGSLSVCFVAKTLLVLYVFF